MKLLFFFCSLLVIFGLSFFFSQKFSHSITATNGAPPYQVDNNPPAETDALSWLTGWKRPEVPAKVGLQVGHWKNDEIPDELYRLKGNTGASGGGKTEWEVNYAIAQRTAELLRTKGITVEILPATIPPKFWADVFVSIHADGSLDNDKSGFKAATPRRDFNGKATKLLTYIEDAYQQTTKLKKDPNVTRNMRGYYAFAWWRYEHAIHPMTPAVILETGFLSSPSDRMLIVDKPELAAQGVTKGVLEYLTEEKLL